MGRGMGRGMGWGREGEGLRAACTNISIAVNGVNNSAGQTLVWMWLRD